MKKLKRAAETGNMLAQGLLGDMYYRGIGVRQDFQEAMHWYKLAGERGDASSQLHLGVMYKTGNGVEQDLKEAVRWLHKAAMQGHAGARLYLGIMYEYGTGGEHGQGFMEDMHCFHENPEQKGDGTHDDLPASCRLFRD